MPTTLTPQEQLTAANSQLKTWFNQRVAQSGAVLGGEYEAKAYEIATSGNYPAIEVAVRNGTSGGFDTIFALPQDIGPYDTIISNNTGAGTGQLINTPRTNLTAEQYTAALATSNQNTKFNSALIAAYGAQVASEDAASAVAASITQPIVNANQGNPVITSTPPTNSSVVNAAADNRDRQNGSVIAPSESNHIAAASVESAVANQAAINADSTATQARIISQASRNEAATADTNTAQSSGDSNITNVSPNIDPRGRNQIPADAVSVDPRPDATQKRGMSEDNPSTSPPVVSETTSSDANGQSFADQTTTTTNGVPSNIGSGSASRDSGGSSIVTSSGAATSGRNSTSSAGSGNGGNTPQSSDTSNKLHAYANWTYKISIYAVPPSTINQMADGSITPGNERAILSGGVFVLSDGGRGASSGDTSFFPTDLGIDNIELESLVSPTQRTRGSDVLTMKFDIIEPYTVSFLEKCKAIQEKFVPGVNASWDTTFFVMIIEFLGYDDLGRPKVIPQTTKYIPFTFLNMTFKVSASGAVYTCTAIPTNLLGNTGIDNVIPFHVETQAQTIGELFEAQSISGSQVTQNKSSRVDERGQTTADLTAQSDLTKGSIIVTKGLQTALNKQEEDKCKIGPDGKPLNKGQYLPNSYIFKFDDSILQATIADPKTFSTQSTGSTSGDNNDSKTQQLKDKGKVGSLVADFSKKTFRAQAGTKITDFINSVIKVSSYMTNQISTSQGDSKPVNVWKINPTVKFKTIDKGTNYYQREITYYVSPYTLRGQDAPGFGQQQVQKSEIVKLYEYIYSGNNRDVIDVNIEYQMAFFEVRNGVSSRYTKDSNSTIEESNPKNVGIYDGHTDNRFFKPRYFHSTGIANQQNTGDTTANDSLITVQNFMEKLFDNGGDMVSLDITIIGDPDWISQDVPLYGPILPSGSYISTGSVNFTNPVYFNFYFATPNKDYDDITGVFNSNGSYSQFSGVYQVISIKSNFNGGKFTQKLTNVRVRNQEPPKQTSSRSDSAPTQSVNSATRGITENPIAEPAKQIVRPDSGGGTQAVSPSAPSIGSAIEDGFQQQVTAGAGTYG